MTMFQPSFTSFQLLNRSSKIAVNTFRLYRQHKRISRKHQNKTLDTNNRRDHYTTKAETLKKVKNLPIRIRIFALPNSLLNSEDTVNPIFYYFSDLWKILWKFNLQKKITFYPYNLIEVTKYFSCLFMLAKAT